MQICTRNDVFTVKVQLVQVSKNASILCPARAQPVDPVQATNGSTVGNFFHQGSVIRKPFAIDVQLVLLTIFASAFRYQQHAV